MALTDDDLQQPVSDSEIVDRVIAAVMEQKLAVGAKLPEIALCEAFGCNRTQIRRVLVVLAERGVVSLHANRGAFIASPDADEARDVFEARRAIERSIALDAAERIDAETLADLNANIVACSEAEEHDRRGDSIRCSGQFHLRLAKAAGNAVLQKFLEELVTRTSLIIGLYGARNQRSCSVEEHIKLVEALEAHDGGRAADLMESHLRHVENALNISDAVDEPVDIRRAFAE